MIVCRGPSTRTVAQAFAGRFMVAAFTHTMITAFTNISHLFSTTLTTTVAAAVAISRRLIVTNI